jgi:hypothetical protein
MAAELETNWVRLEPGKPVRLHFSDHNLAQRTITDPWFKGPKSVQSIVFRVDSVDGVAVDKVFSVISDKLRGDLQGYLPDKRYVNYDFVIVKDAPGTVPPRLVTVEPRT